jgi:UDP-N-acetylmuramoyl-L-alanyl-D-glutamate--2,6-diaminopimelate ligase
MDTTERLITVFGATGDRDRGKRPKMGKIVDQLSDIVILTDDDTYTEDSTRIIRDVTEGISRHEGEGFWIIPSREDAIRTACIMLRPGDVLVVAGK